MRFLSIISLCLSLVLSSSAMTPMQRVVLFGQPSLSPTAQAIVNTLKQQGTPPTDTQVRWIVDNASISKNYAALYQPASSTVIGFGVKGTGKLAVNWGDGTSTNVTLTVTEQKLVHNYATAAKRPVVIVGNVSYLRNAADASYGGVLSANFGGRIDSLTSLTVLSVTGNNTLSGSVAGLTSLTAISVGGNNTLSGSVAGLTSLTALYVYGNNTVSGSVAGLTSLTAISVDGNNTVSGSVAGLTSLTFLYITGNNTVSGWELLSASNGKLSMFVHGGLTVLSSAQVNAILAGFWANRDAAKPRASERVISIASNGSGAPTGQGLTDKAALAGYKSPNNTGPMYWTVTTP